MSAPVTQAFLDVLAVSGASLEILVAAKEGRLRIVDVLTIEDKPTGSLDAKWSGLAIGIFPVLGESIYLDDGVWEVIATYEGSLAQMLAAPHVAPSIAEVVAGSDLPLNRPCCIAFRRTPTRYMDAPHTPLSADGEARWGLRLARTPREIHDALLALPGYQFATPARHAERGSGDATEVDAGDLPNTLASVGEIAEDDGTERLDLNG